MPDYSTGNDKQKQTDLMKLPAVRLTHTFTALGSIGFQFE